MRKNRNALMIKDLDKLINAMKDIYAGTNKFEEVKRECIERTIEYKRKLGDISFLNSKELKKYIINEKINDIENDFKN